MTKDFEGTFPSGTSTVFDDDGSANWEHYWDDDSFKPHEGRWNAWPASGGVDSLDPEKVEPPN